MFLKKLEITGFKSFANKSVIDFDNEKSITSIVGPNGSGKSNVADAVRWVLGEQSYKTIRSKKSEDIIFSGSNAKSKASGARVSMLLDNTDGRAPIDFGEVEIERAVYRDGSSEYLINGKKARLLDVAELLAKSGFGQSTYSVIGQGMVDSMLFYGPAERKVLFDEAAGVRQYELKREQTIRKLSDTAQNVIRIKDILSELNPRLNTLRRQAEKAKQKDDLSLQLLEKQKIYFASIWDNLSHKESAKRKELDALTAEEQKVKEELKNLNERFEKILNQEKADSSKLDEIRSKINGLEDKKDKIRQEIYTGRAQLEMRYSDSLSKEDIESKINDLKKQLSELGLEKRETEKIELEKKLANSNFDGLRSEISRLEDEKDSFKQKTYTLRAKLDVFDSSNALSRADIDQKIKILNDDLNELKISEKEKSQAEIQKKLDKLEIKLAENQKKIESKKTEFNNLKAELESFDFGTVNDELKDILETQNLFMIKVESVTRVDEIKKVTEMGQRVIGSLEKLITRVSGAKKGALAGMTDIQLEIEKLSNHKESIVSEINDVRGLLLEGSHLINSLIRRRSEIKSEIEKLQNVMPVDISEKSKLGKELKTVSEKIEKIENEITQKRQELASEDSIKRELDNIGYVIERELARKKEIEEHISKLNSTKPVDEREKKKFEQNISEKEVEVERLNKEISKIKLELDENSNDFTSAGKRLTEIKDSITKKQLLLNEFTQETTNLKVDLAKIETKKLDIKDEINRELGGEELLAGVKAIPEIDEEITRHEIDKLKNRLYSIGEIDAEVESEYEEVNQRVDYLSGQIGDLEKAKEDLETLIKDLDLKIKKQFEISFESISNKFKHFFELLFDGGEAKLELVIQKDEDGGEDKFGIEITAVPPGKRVKSLSALSGGERTLTSLALLFAILSVNPAPFILLDEVDAALDEPNTKRFIKIVHELSKATQFIFITHNRETMKEANIIYGVTMDDSHASRLLSVKLNDALDVIEKKPHSKKDKK